MPRTVDNIRKAFIADAAEDVKVRYESSDEDDSDNKDAIDEEIQENNVNGGADGGTSTPNARNGKQYILVRRAHVSVIHVRSHCAPGS